MLKLVTEQQVSNCEWFAIAFRGADAQLQRGEGYSREPLPCQASRSLVLSISGHAANHRSFHSCRVIEYFHYSARKLLDVDQ